MNKGNETHERIRERLRHEEQKRNPSEKLKDALDKNRAGNLTDLVDSLGVKGIGVLILIMIIGFVVVTTFFK